MAENSEITGKKPRGTGKRFAKGQTGNPGGRPARTPQELDLIAACKDKTQAALDVLTKIMEEGENERNRFAAAMAIIERGHGKAVQPTTLGNPDGSKMDMNWSISLVKPEDAS
jgi:hypothetical protein